MTKPKGKLIKITLGEPDPQRLGIWYSFLRFDSGDWERFDMDIKAIQSRRKNGIRQVIKSPAHYVQAQAEVFAKSRGYL